MEIMNVDNYMPAAVAPKSVQAEAVISRQAQEVKAAMQVAKMFPRDENAAYSKIMTACQRTILAETAVYRFPRGGTSVTGPSIRLAEVLAQAWGNIDYGVLELENRNGESTMMAYAWDLETNTRRQMTFVVKHERKAKGRIDKLDDPRDIYELVANNGSRRVRACILGVIPGDVVDAAVEKCNQTLANGNSRPLKDRIRETIALFGEKHSVTQEMLEKFIGSNADAFSEQDMVKLKHVWTSLRDGMGKREDFFDIKRPETAAPKSDAIAGFEEHLKQQEGAANAETERGQS